MAVTLPIFPQRRVLLPGSSCVLRAFDDALRALVDESTGNRFGVTLIRPGGDGPSDFHAVGTEVSVTGRMTTPDGRLTVQAKGERRFSILQTSDAASYTRADVEFLPDVVGDARGDATLCSRVSHLLRRYLAATAESGLGGDVMVEVATEPVALSYQVASLVRLSSPERQELLELSARARLSREAALLAREVDLLERMMGTERT